MGPSTGGEGFPHPNAGTWPLKKRLAVARLFLKSERIRTRAAHFGELAEYVGMVESTFGGFEPLRDREEVWSRMVARINTPAVTVFEFGVAWGYATDWWLRHLVSDGLVLHGFDSFMGLPTAGFRDFAPGAYSAEGRPPDIADPRVRWHVGLVEETLPLLDIQRQPGEQYVVLFDLDLYAPSLVVWEHLRDHLRPGDILYFDEAYDSNERRLLLDSILPWGRFELIGASTVALGMQIST